MQDQHLYWSCLCSKSPLICKNVGDPTLLNKAKFSSIQEGKGNGRNGLTFALIFIFIMGQKAAFTIYFVLGSHSRNFRLINVSIENFIFFFAGKEQLTRSPIWTQTLSEDDINKHSLIVEQEKSYKANLVNSLKSKLGNTLEISNFSYSIVEQASQLQASTPIFKGQTPTVNTEYSVDNFCSYEKSKSNVVTRGKISDSNTCKTDAIRIMGENDFSSDLFSASDQSKYYSL